MTTIRNKIADIDMYFVGIETETRNLACITSVGLVNEFKKTDVLLEFVIPKDITTLKRSDLFQQVYIPGLGYL
jgi:hypothetical protein